MIRTVEENQELCGREEFSVQEMREVVCDYLELNSVSEDDILTRAFENGDLSEIFYRFNLAKEFFSK